MAGGATGGVAGGETIGAGPVSDLAVGLIIAAPLSTLVWFAIRRDYKVLVLFCVMTLFAGTYLRLEERIREVTVQGVGSIKAAAKQAATDAAYIAEIKERVERQSATIDAVARQAAALQERFAPRTLPEDRRRTALTILRRHGGARVAIYYAGDAEARQFADALAGVFREGGWIVRSEGVLSWGGAEGVVLEANDPQNLTAEGKALLEATEIATAARVPVRRVDSKTQALALVVGVKPGK